MKMNSEKSFVNFPPNKQELFNVESEKRRFLMLITGLFTPSCSSRNVLPEISELIFFTRVKSILCQKTYSRPWRTDWKERKEGRKKERRIQTKARKEHKWKQILELGVVM